jgi:methyltransferase
MTIFDLTIAYLVVARLIELFHAQSNTRRLLASGAVEHGRSHYPLIVALHALWIAALLVAVPRYASPDMILLGLFGLLQIARVWVIASLGRYWTTRILTLPSAPLVRRGPYRFIRHPNYLVVALEIPVLSGAFHAWWLALGFGLANLAILSWRIRTENLALAPRRGIETRQA